MKKDKKVNNQVEEPVVEEAEEVYGRRMAGIDIFFFLYTACKNTASTSNNQ